MAHHRFEFPMPASTAVVFDAFHYHHWRGHWDSLVRDTRVQGGAECPFVGAVTQNAGKGLLGSLSMRTRFVSYERPRLAAAAMDGKSFPFTRWAASMRHRPLADGTSLLVYTYSFEVGPAFLRWILAPFVELIFRRQTQRRFARLASYLKHHAPEIEAWQRSRAVNGS
jgi:hypothetical protein